ncbi:MAG: two-component system response regulator [bacterium]
MANQKKRVLIVDDEYSSRRLLEKILRSYLNCDVLQAEEGSVALQIMVKENPDLVILDLVMPFMNGVEVLKTMRKTANLRDIQVVVCTSIDDQTLVKKVIEFGVKKYLVKPLSKEKVVDVISELLV